jgi:hypothetical protein
VPLVRNQDRCAFWTRIKIVNLTKACAEISASGLFAATGTPTPAPGFGLSAPSPATGGSLFGGTPAPAPTGKTTMFKHVTDHHLCNHFSTYPFTTFLIAAGGGLFGSATPSKYLPT